MKSRIKLMTKLEALEEVLGKALVDYDDKDEQTVDLLLKEVSIYRFSLRHEVRRSCKSWPSMTATVKYLMHANEDAIMGTSCAYEKKLYWITSGILSEMLSEMHKDCG